MNLLYENALSCADDVKNFILEGQARINFEDGKMQLENIIAAENKQKANYVLWCPVEFPSDVLITWDFRSIKEPGLCMLFFAAKGINGEEIFDPAINVRSGEYPAAAERRGTVL